MLERINSPIGVEAPEVVEMCSDPLLVRFAWLVSPNDSVIADTDPRLAKLDIFFLTVVAANDTIRKKIQLFQIPSEVQFLCEFNYC